MVSSGTTGDGFGTFQPEAVLIEIDIQYQILVLLMDIRVYIGVINMPADYDGLMAWMDNYCQAHPLDKMPWVLGNCCRI
jgi:hypothetical protein